MGDWVAMDADSKLIVSWLTGPRDGQSAYDFMMDLAERLAGRVRQNLTMRMSNRRYTRLTNAFSKKLRNHEHHNALHFVHYNFCRIHKTLRMTPAMAAGVTNTLRDTDWIVSLIDARAPKPQKPGPKGPWKHKR